MFALQPNQLPTAFPASGKTTCPPLSCSAFACSPTSCFSGTPAVCETVSPQRRLVEASLTPLTFLLLAGALLTVTPAHAQGAAAVSSHTQSAVALRVDRLIAAHPARFAPDLSVQLRRTAQQKDAQTLIPVIVQTDGATPELARPLLGKMSYSAYRTDHAHVGAFVSLNRRGTLAARLTAVDIARLGADAHTRHISPDLPIQACDAGTSAPVVDYAMQATGADFLQSHNSLTGKGVTVAVLDTGIYPHDDLTTPYQRLTGWADLVNNKSKPYDDNGHGTHVAGLVGGDGAASYQNHYSSWLLRTAPLANLVGVKVLDKDGSGSVSTVIAGIDWCVAHKAALNIRVLNLSVGHPIGESYKTDPLCQACERAWAAGITVVCAAGNYGRSVPSDQTSAPQYGSITSPGNDPHVITVGAMNTMATLDRGDDRICSYSSRGPSAVDLVLKPDLVAPGNNMISLAAPGSALYTQAGANLLDPKTFGGNGGRAYLTLSGTSMASPVVAGAAALLLQADPTLTPDTIKARLMLSASKIAGSDYLTYGAGYLNVVGALQLTQVSATGTISPNLVRNLDGSVSVANFGWGGGSILGQNFGWGGDLGDKKLTGDEVAASNFGWGGDLGEKKLTDYATPMNFAWGDSVFTPSGLFGGIVQVPQNFGTAPAPLWSGSVAPLSTPGQTDAMHLLFDGD